MLVLKSLLNYFTLFLKIIKNNIIKALFVVGEYILYYIHGAWYLFVWKAAGEKVALNTKDLKTFGCYCTPSTYIKFICEVLDEPYNLTNKKIALVVLWADAHKFIWLQLTFFSKFILNQVCECIKAGFTSIFNRISWFSFEIYASFCWTLCVVWDSIFRGFFRNNIETSAAEAIFKSYTFVVWARGIGQATFAERHPYLYLTTAMQLTLARRLSLFWRGNREKIRTYYTLKKIKSLSTKFKLSTKYDILPQAIQNIINKIITYWICYVKPTLTVVNFFFKTIFLGVVVCLGVLYYFFIAFYLTQLKQICIWFFVSVIFFFLFSTFTFFLKHNKFGKFTSALQRFWKRANVCFWVVELCLFVLGFYYFLNASQEPVFMSDTTHFSLNNFINPAVSIWPLCILAAVAWSSYMLILYINFISFRQVVTYLLVVLVALIYLTSIEGYQLAYLTNTMYEAKLLYDNEADAWVLEWENERTRVRYHYFTFCLLLKFWHFLFMAISWFFLILKTLDERKPKITLWGVNIQNTVILYVLTAMYNIYWLKWSIAKFLDQSYFYFGTNFDYILFSEILWDWYYYFGL